MAIDTIGNVHQPAGSPSGGQFAGKLNTPPPGVLPTDSPSSSLRARRGASLNRGEFGPFGLASMHAMPGSESEAFTGTLTLEGRPVGTVRQEGRGGGTWCQFHSADARAQFEQMVIDNWDFDQVFPVSDEEFMELPHDDASVLDALYFEEKFRAQLNSDRARGKLPVLTAEDHARIEQADGVQSYGTFPGRVAQVHEVTEDLRASGDLGGALYWDGDVWVPFEASAATAFSS